MAKSSNQKLKLLYIVKLLAENTDEEHVLSTQEIIERLSEYGIKAERKSNDEETDKKGRVIRSERFMGTCQRTFYVGDHVKKEDVAAAYEDGVLKLNVPKKVETPKVEESHLIDIQ